MSLNYGIKGKRETILESCKQNAADIDIVIDTGIISESDVHTIYISAAILLFHIFLFSTNKDYSLGKLRLTNDVIQYLHYTHTLGNSVIC